MPFTPLHMGPGLLTKAILQSSFSLMIFGWSQIIMDIQPLLVMVTGRGNLHGISHTVIGATVIAIFSAITGKYCSEYFFVWLDKDFTELQKSIFDLPKFISYKVAFLSAFIGTYSHILLDSVIHSDLRPLFPISDNNALLDLTSYERVNEICIYSGIVGTILYFMVRLMVVKSSHKLTR